MTKTILRIFNIIYSALAIGAICCFLFIPFINSRVSYNLTPSTLEALVGQAVDVPLTEKDYEDIISPEGLSVGVNFDITSIDLGEVLFKNSGSEKVDTFIKDSVNGIIVDLAPGLVRLGRTLVAKVSVESLNSGIENVIQKALDELMVPGLTPQEIMTNCGINEDYITNIAKTIGKVIFPDKDETTGEYPEVTIDDVKLAFQTEINNMYSLIANKYPVFEGYTIKEEHLNEVLNNVETALIDADIIRSDGTIRDIETYVAIKLQTEDKASSSTLKKYAPHEGEPKLDEVLTVQLTKLIGGDSATNSIVLVLKIMSFVLAFMILGWVIFLVMTIIKTITQKPWIHTWLIFWVNAILQLVLGGILTLLIFLLKGPLHDTALSWIPSDLSAMTNIEISSFQTSALYPAIIVIVMIISFFFYGHYKRKYKRELAEKK